MELRRSPLPLPDSDLFSLSPSSLPVVYSTSGGVGILQLTGGGESSRGGGGGMLMESDKGGRGSGSGCNDNDDDDEIPLILLVTVGLSDVKHECGGSGGNKQSL